MPEAQGSGQPAEETARIARARNSVARALVVAARGRQAAAERMLREAQGVLERRQRFAGAARAAATLGQLLRERGDTAGAGAALQQARLLAATVDAATDGVEPADSGALDPPAAGEWEDYRAARRLLHFPAARPAPPPEPSLPRAPQPGVLLDRAAEDFVAIARAVEAAPPGEAPARVCEALCERLEAQSAAVWRLAPKPTRVACAGDAERSLPEPLRAAAAAGRIEPLVVAGTRLRTALPVPWAAAPIGALILRWSRTPLDVDRPVAVARMAAALLANDFDSPPEAQPGSPAAGGAGGLLGSSGQMAALRAAIGRAAGAPYPVLIEGETGAGKELVARALHLLGPRRTHAFCAINCAALTDELFEAELFGHTRGAFTGALTDRPGLFETADGGTLFLDEVGELTARAQAKLLRVVQEGEIRRVGENAVRRVDVRLVAATNRSLAAEAAAGRFRQDLLYRLNVVNLAVPPLRERPGDVELLARHFWRAERRRAGTRATLGDAALEGLRRHPWPGNVRELQNVVARLALAAPARGRLGAEALPAAIRSSAAAPHEPLVDARLNFERRHLLAALTRNGGHTGAAAAELGVSRQALGKRLKRLGLDWPDPPPA